MARFIESTKQINKAAQKQRKPKQQKPKQQKPKQNASANKPASNKAAVTKTSGNKNKAGGSQYSVKQDRQITSRQTQAPKNNSVNRNTRENTNRATQRYSTNTRNGAQYSVANSANRRATRNYKQQQNNRFESRKNELKDSNILKSTKTATNNDIRRMGGAQYKVDNSSRREFGKRIANLTEGSVKQVVGGHLTSISHQNDRTGYDLEMERITDLYKKGKIDKPAYEAEMKSLQEREKQGKKKSEVYESKARAIQDAGDKQVQEGMKGLSGISKVGAEAYNSLIGMGMDMTLGPASLVGMASRTYGNSLNSLNKLVKKGIISAEEAERYAAMQSAKEVGTELLFKGAGAAAGYAGAGKATEKLSLMAKRGIDKATQRINNNVLKNVVSTGLRLGQGAAEEATEEAIAGLLDAPITNIAYANRLDKEYRGSLEENGTSINSQRDQMMKYGYTRGEATAIFVDEIGSDDYLNELAQQYIDDGMSEKKALKQAKNMQEYMIASLNGDEKTMQALEDKMAEGIKAKFSLSDTLEAMAAAGLMTAVTGGLGSVNTMAKGEMYKNIYAKANGTENAAEAITKIAKGLSDKEMAARATAMYEHASQGKELSHEQYVELGQAIEKQAAENSSKAQSAIKVASNQAESEGFYVSATPQKIGGRYAFGHNSVETQFGSVIIPEGPTQQRSEEVRKTAYAVADQIEAELGTALNDKDALVEEITAAECGFASGDIVEYLTDAFPENRAVYEAITGVKLPADNAKMRDAVFTRAIEKNVEMAKAETIERIDLDTGNLDVQYANDFGGEGQQLFHVLTNNISTRDKETSIRYRTAFREIYDAGRNGASLDAAMEYARDVHNLDKADVIEIFNAGIKDKDNKDIPTVTYNVSDPSKIKNSEREVFLAFSRAFGVNIVITDDFTVSDGQMVGGQESVDESNTQVNGMYYDNTIYLNLNDDIHKSVGYTIMHELTHGIKQMFPEDYDTFAELFKERWIAKNGEESFSKAIQGKIKTYADNNVSLSEADALEEIICDQMAEVLYDEQFMQNIAENHPSLAQSLLYAIQDVIRKIRQLFANYGGFRSEFNEATLSQLDMLKDAEALLVKAIQAAQDGRTQEILGDAKKFSVDSNGNNLSPQQSEYFKDSKVRDENGNLIPVYHGTNDAGFTEFKRTNNFYTDSKEVAGTYTKTGGIYEGYLNIINPLVIDCNNERWSRIEFEQIDSKVTDLFAEYGGSTFEEDDAERTSTADIVSVVEDGIEDGVLDYDGIILKNIYDEGMYGDYESGSLLSNVYITFNSNQFKNRDNLEPTESPDIRFSIVEDSNGEYNVNELETSLKERFKEYETDEENLKLATEVVADIGKIRLSVDGDTDDVRRNTSGIRTIAKGISEQFINEGYIDFRGRKVNGPEDVAAMMQVCRDPRFETFRIILVKGNEVVSVRNMSSRLPGISAGTESPDAQESYRLMKDRMRRSQADGYYLVHNHPSGKVEASSMDKMSTAMYINNVRGFKGHIILDHNKYGLIENIPEYDKKSGYTLPKASEVEIGGQLTIDFMNIPEVEHRMLGKSLGNKADSIASTIKQLQTSKTASIVLYADSQLKVREIQEIDNTVIENQKHLKSYIFNEGVRCGARMIFVGSHKFETYSTLREMVRDGILTDAFLLFDNIDARSARVDDSITPLVSEDDIANNRRLVVYDGTKDYESNSLSEVIPSKESVIQYSIDNPWDTSWFDGILDDEEVNTRGDKNKSIAEISAEFTNIVRDNAKLTGGKVLDRKSIKKQIGELVKMTTKDTTYTAKEKREIADFLMDTAEQIWSIVGEKRPMKLKQEEIDRIINLLYDASDYVISNAKYINDTMLDEIIEFKKFFRGREVGVSAGARAELADDWDTIRKRNFGRVRFVSAEKNGVTNIADALIQTFPEAPEISLLYGREIEEALEIGDEATLVRILDDVLSNLSVVVDDAIKSEYAEDFRVALSQDFARIVLNEGEAWESKMDRFKDRYEQRIKDMRARQKEAVRDLRSNYEKLLAEQNATFKKKLAETKAKSEAKLQAEKDKQKAKEQKRKDSEQRKKIRNRIAEDYNWLAQRLVKPKKDDFKHIPSDFVESVANLLEIFDFQTERSLQLEEKRGYASGATKAMRELKDKISKYSSPDGSNTFIKNDALDALIDECINFLDDRPLRELEDNELQKVSDILRAVRHMVQTQNALFVENRKVGVAEAGESIISESAKKMEKYGRRYDRTGISGKLSHLLNETMMTPGNFFDSLGGTMKALYKNLRNAQDDYIMKVKFLRDFYKNLLGGYYKKAKPGSAVEDWQTQTNEFTLSDGSKLNITVAQVMSLYCLSKREQALGHITAETGGSGIVLSDVTIDRGVAKVIGGKIQNTASGYRMKYNDVMNVISSLTDEQKRIADAIQNLMNTTLKEWGNETSLRLFDMEFFTEENYFPISVEQSELATEIGKGTEIKGNRITSFGMTKPLTEHANNKIIIGDIFSIAADHCNKMALYSAYAPSLIDFNRVYNYKQRNEDGTTGYTVKGILKDAYSNKALKFIDNILDDINGQAKPRTDGLTAMINTSLANYKKAAIGLNMRVLVQQPTAIMRSLYMINPKYFTPDCFVSLKSAREEMHEHCPIAAWKAWGNYQNDYTKNFEDVMLNKDWSKFDAVTMGAYGWADDMTWAVIWNAVKKEVKHKNPDIKVGSEEYWNLCNERASEIYDETQVVDSVFHRSDAMRNPDKLSKVVTSFMAEPTRTYNMVRSSIVKAYRSHKDGDNKAAAAELNKMLVVVVLNAAAVSAAAAVVDAFRGKGDDDDEETWLETFYRNFGENFKDNVNMLHNIVYVKDVVSFFENAVGEKYFSPSNMVFDGWVKLAKGVGDYDKVLSGDKSFIEWISGDFGAGIGYVTGIPTATFIKDTKALWNRLSLPTFASDGVDEETPSLWDYENNPLEVTDGTWADNVLNFFGINLTPEERAERDFKRTLESVKNKTKNLSGAEKKEEVNKIVMEGYTSLVEDGDFAKLKQMRRIIEAAGGDVEAFDEKVTKRTASEYKKTIGVEADMAKQAEMRQYLLENGWTEAKISGEIVYKSNLAKDFKKACRELDIEKGTDVLTYLILAGITEADAYKLWENRNRGNFDTYSTGKYIAPTNGQITSGFGYRSSPTAGASSYHQGIDIAASRGSVVSAADGGKVVYAGYNGGYGNQIVIQHDDGTQTYYSHLDHISVRKGQSVSQKQYIGNVGSTGISTGPHLDFRVNVGGQFVDPLKYFSV